jgi:hypothetical protein
MVKLKRGQTTIFIIIAIVLVATISAYFVYRDVIKVESFPDNIQEIENTFLSCVEETALDGISLLEARGGYIEIPSFERGTSYSPFSSELDFFGVSIPYWYYLSGNNVEKEQVPSMEEMELQLENYVEDKISKCRFDEYISQGYSISRGIPLVEIEIKDSKVLANVFVDLEISNELDNYVISEHDVEVGSKLGELYNSALEIYNQEQESLFLEDYGVDFLRNYLPVDGVEFSCAPKVWNAEELFVDFKEALEANTFSMKSSGDVGDYFLVDNSVKNDFRFIYSKNWPYSFEVNPTNGNLLVAEPVGTQEGMGILGFCYLTYHFIYDMKYPVLVQVYEGEETFQFPLAVVLKGNNAREPFEGAAVSEDYSDVCEYAVSDLKVSLYDRSSRLVDGEVIFECLGDVCNLGETENGMLDAKVPECYNGNLVVHASGFKDSETLYSTIEPGSVSVILEKEYEREVILEIDGLDYNQLALINFVSDDSSSSLVYPENREVVLAEGEYEVEVFIYDESSLTIPETVQEQCVETTSGIGGLFGLTNTECFEFNVSEQILTNVLSGGGNTNTYFTSFGLEGASGVKISTTSFDKPTSIEDLQENYILFETNGVEVDLI